MYRKLPLPQAGSRTFTEASRDWKASRRSAGGLFVAGVGEGVDSSQGGLPLAAEGLHDHGLDDQVDVGGAGVVGAELGALGGVEGALEEGAEDGGLDVAPVLLRGLVELQH